jgi:hypothetical protein
MRRRLFSVVLRGAAAAALAAMLLVPVVLAAEPGGPGQRPDGAQQATRRPDARMLPPGSQAPDFELPRLVTVTDKDGNAAGKISDEKVKLSSLAGKKPVCLIFTSYT